MTMRERDVRAMPADIGALGERVLKPGNPYRVIGDRLPELLADADFAGLYAPTGRAAVWPATLALVTLFQYREHLPDRRAAEAVAARIDWKYALRLPLDYAGFDHADLCNFRKRLLAGGAEALVFEALLAKVAALGFLGGKGRQRTDSLAVVGAVRELSALELAVEALRVCVRAAERAAPAWAARALPASFRERYARAEPVFRLSKEERAGALAEAGEDGCWLLDRLDEAPGRLRALAEVGTLRAVWAQRFERAGGRVRVRAELPDCTELILSPHDPGARAAEKRGKKWVGDKVHVTETAAPGGPNFLTDVATAAAPSGDGEALAGIRARLAARGLTPGAQVVDAGYVSGRHLAESEADGVRLVGPPLADTSRNGFKLADFAIDRAARRATCPAGAVSARWSERADRDGTRAVSVRFAAATCAACPLRYRCTESKSGRSLHLGEHHERLQARRAEAGTPEFKEETRARPAVEATLSELVRGYGLRRHRYRGEAKRRLENALKGAACNLYRLARALAERERAARAMAA
jgi:transposase